MSDEKSDSIDLITSSFECEADEIIDISHDLELNSALASALATVPMFSSSSLKCSDLLQWKRTGKLYLVIWLINIDCLFLRYGKMHYHFYLDFPWSTNLQQILTNILRIDSFHPLQLETINATLSCRDCVLIMPAGCNLLHVYNENAGACFKKNCSLYIINIKLD